MSTTYQFNYTADGVYGRTVRLAAELAGNSGVVLDLGCGYGAIAEPLRDLGLTYVGADTDGDGIADLRKRGFESHVIDLARVSELLPRLREILAGRKLAAIAMLDVLEHVPHNLEILTALRELSAGDAAALLVSIPNVGHRDIAFKLLTGRWEYTETGLLDRTHIIHHTESLLHALMVSAGWRVVAVDDLPLEESDQHFPDDSIVLNARTQLSRFLRRVREESAPQAVVNQFVRAYLPAHARPMPIVADRSNPARPFLSVVVRTQGRRPATLRDALLCLAAQSCDDFEVLLIAHKVAPELRPVIERIVEDLPQSLRRRTRVTGVDHGNRTTPLNVAFAQARGVYISVLDDDDLVLGHWVETFKDLGTAHPGQVLRSVAVEQDIEEHVADDGALTYQTVSAPRRPYPREFDLYAHFTQNFTPQMCLAFPGALFRELGFHFDEELDTCEDWDMELRAVLTCGIATSPEYTAIYRRWRTGHASNTVHSQEIWEANHARITKRLNRQTHLFPPGTVDYIRWTTRHMRELEDELASLRDVVRPPPPPPPPPVPLRYKVADRLNLAIKRTPAHAVLKKLLGGKDGD
ncbi:MAG TPA: methyltransferase domain-containing protein [Myxococcales bacterium]|jgi:2-polyprenyl-3-methyl-5-hydroxy-6-metoxy-1,4-benzoquinol methylase